MTVYLPKGATTYYYDFWWRRRRYRDTTHQQRVEDARLVESRLKLQLRQEVGGIAALDASRSPRIAEWAEIYVVRTQKTLTRPERIEHLLRVVLRFWGPRPDGTNPKNPPIAGEPYHDLRLLDPILEPEWIARFETWMDARGRAGQTRNQYRSVMSGLYKLALQPMHRTRTKVTSNPFAGLFRDRGGARTVALEAEDVRGLLAHASYHVRLAIAIGALAPKLRLGNILALQWARHLDRDFRYITVEQHKTAQHTGRPLVLAVPEQLRAILIDARRRTAGPFVVAYQGRPIAEIRGGLKGAAKRAGLTYGRLVEHGLTFHTLRHTAATLLAELDVAEGKRMAMLGHTRIETTQLYTHMRPRYEVATAEQLSAALPIADLVTAAWRRATAPKPVGGTLGNTCLEGSETPTKPAMSAQTPERPDLRLVPKTQG